MVGVLVLLLFSSHVAAAEEAEFRIGAALPLTGETATFGVDVKRGMELAVEDLAAKGVRSRLFFEDTQLVPRLAVSAAQKLINQDKVQLLVSMWDTAEAVAPIAERAKVPHISIRWNPRVAEEFAHTFTFESTYVTWIGETLDLVKRSGASRISVMTDASGAGWVLAHENLLAQAKEKGLSVVTDVEVMAKDSEVNTAVTRLLSKPTDYIVLLQMGGLLRDVMGILQERHVTTPIIGYFEGTEDLPFAEGRPFIAQFESQPWFLEKFHQRYPGEVPMRAAFGYDLVSVLGDLILKLGRQPTEAEILQHYNTLRAFKGATGEISANDRRNIETKCVVKEIRNGKPTLLNKAPTR